jgi:hypothetical protein
MLSLHMMISRNEDESDEGDELRELMTPEWYRMTEEERNIARGTSRDFYTIFDSSRFNFGQENGKNRLIEIQNLLKTKQLEDALKGIRDLEPVLAEDVCASIRAAIWSNFGFHEIANAFYKRLAIINDKYFEFSKEIA